MISVSYCSIFPLRHLEKRLFLSGWASEKVLSVPVGAKLEILDMVGPQRELEL